MTIKEAIRENLQFITDGGLETTFLYDYGIPLPHFAAFITVLKLPFRKKLEEYYRKYLDLAVRYNTGFILESPTWRASEDWGKKLNYDKEELFHINQRSIYFLEGLKAEYENRISPIYISGCIGPRSDGYKLEAKMTVEEAMKYHHSQIIAFKHAGADLITALTINYIEEGLGIALTAREFDLPVVISFTVDTNGKLPDGSSLEDAIIDIDWSTGSYPLYYMINCAYPTNYFKEINGGGDWLKRIKGSRSNASSLSHEELNSSTTIQSESLDEFSDSHVLLKSFLPDLQVFGGCCGSDHHHIESLCDQLLKRNRQAYKADFSIF